MTSYNKSTRIAIILSVLVFSLIIVMAVLEQGTYGEASTLNFSAPANLSNDPNIAQYPWVAAYGNYVYVAWTEQSHGIAFRSSANNGSTWSSTLRLNSGKGTTNYPVMVANGSDVYVIWTQFYSGNGTIYVSTSTDNGTSFNSATALSQANVNADIPFIAEYGSNVYVIWHQVTLSGAQSVWVSSSNNYGASWSAAQEIDNGNGLAGAPQIAAFGNYAYATWNGGGAWFSASNNSGVSWSAPVNVATPNTQDVDSPWVAGYGSNVYVTWNDNATGVYAPYISISNDNGANWAAIRESLFPHATNDYQVQVAASGNYTYVIFRDHSSHYPNSRNGSVIFEASQNNGSTWLPYYTSTSGDLQNGSEGITGWADGIAVSGNNVGFAYLSGCSVGQYEPFPNSGNGDCNMYASYSNDSGTSFNQAQLSTDFLAGPIRQISSSNFAMSGSNLYVAWQDNSTSNFQIFFSANSVGSVNTTAPSTTTSTNVTTIASSSSSSSSANSNTSIISTTTSLSVASSSTAQSTTTTATTSTSSPSSSGLGLYATIATIVIVVAIVISAVALYRRRTATRLK